MRSQAALPAGLPPEASPDQVARAAERLAGLLHATPVLTSRALDEASGGTVFLKCENFQRAGAFKIRGALNALLQLSDAERARGVITHSSGNHGQALALAGRLLGVDVCVVMPSTAPRIKRAATAGYGARIVTCEPTLAAREAAVAAEASQHDYHLVHPYDDWRVIAGQGTAAWELLDQVEGLDLVLAPCGGGGLLAGTALAVQGKSPGTRVVGVEPSLADDARRSLEQGTIVASGDPPTIADGLRASLGTRGFRVIEPLVDQILTVSEQEILTTMQFLMERMKMVVEPSGAVPVAAVLGKSIAVQGKRVGVIVSGGNLDVQPLFEHLGQRWLAKPAGG